MTLALLALFLMMIVVTANAVGRYLYNSPISGTYELTELYLMAIVIFLTAPRLQREGGNINVDIVYDRLSDRARTLVDLLGKVLAVLIFAPVAYRVGVRSWNGFVEGRVSVGVVEFPIYLSWFIMFLGLALLSVRLVYGIRTDATELRRLIDALQTARRSDD